MLVVLGSHGIPGRGDAVVGGGGGGRGDAMEGVSGLKKLGCVCTCVYMVGGRTGITCLPACTTPFLLFTSSQFTHSCREMSFRTAFVATAVQPQRSGAESRDGNGGMGMGGIKDGPSLEEDGKGVEKGGVLGRGW